MTGTEVSIKVLGGLCDLIPNRAAAQILSDAYVDMGGPEFDETDYEIARRFLAILPDDKKQQIISNGAKYNGMTATAYIYAIDGTVTAVPVTIVNGQAVVPMEVMGVVTIVLD